MPTFNKSRGFKLKSGNEANAAFKMMGSSPIQQQADATLVQAAQNAAMANVPKDNSAQYQKAADAATTASKAQTEALTSIIKEAPGMIIGATKAIKEGTAKRKAKKQVVETARNMGDDRSKKEIKQEFNKTYKDIKSMDVSKKSKVSEARKLTGVDGSVADKDRDYKSEHEQQKYRKKLEKNKKKKTEGNVISSETNNSSQTRLLPDDYVLGKKAKI